jgi:hypothetical protein
MELPVDDVVRSAFSSTLAFLPEELARMPLSRWSEPVFRYLFCRSLADAYPCVKQLVECGRIDLVLHGGEEKAFVEFKFYLRPRRYDPYTGRLLGFKGGPGAQNLREFRRCVNDLSRRRSVPGLSKYVVLAYADPSNGGSPRNRYSDDYDDYLHPDEDVALEVLQSRGPIESAEGQVKAKLFVLR